MALMLNRVLSATWLCEAGLSIHINFLRHFCKTTMGLFCKDICTERAQSNFMFEISNIASWNDMK